MRVKILAVVSSVLVGCLGWLPAALADDVNPPPYEGLPNSIVLFTSDQGSGLHIDDFDVFPGGFPLSDIDFGLGPGEPFLLINPSGDSSRISFGLPNFVDPLPLKLLRIQMTYFGPDPIIQSVFGVDPTCGGNTCPGVFVQHVPDTATTPDASYFFEDWVILPNPDFEHINMFAGPGTRVVQVVIDTFSTSVPVPSTLLLFGGGIGSLLGHRWWRGRRHSTAARA